MKNRYTWPLRHIFSNCKRFIRRWWQFSGSERSSTFWMKQHPVKWLGSPQASNRHTQIPHMRWEPSEPTLEVLDLLDEILHSKGNNRWCEGKTINLCGVLLNLQRLQDIEAGIPTWKLLNKLEFLRNVRAESMETVRYRSHGNRWCAVQRVHQSKTKMKKSWAIPKFKGWSEEKGSMKETEK